MRNQAPAKPPRKRAGRQPLPAQLPRIEHRHEPARFFVPRYIRLQYASRPCEPVTAGPIPPAVIDGGMAAVSLLAWVATANTPTTCLCIGSSRLRRDKACRWPARHWPSGSAASALPCGRWPTGSPSCCANDLACMPTKRRCASSILAAARPNTSTCGPTDPTDSKKAPSSSCSITRPVALAPARARSCATGAAI
jgi:hypothetical protein